ncbi:MAG: hypothetical protein QOI16_1272 [Pseudonocardiales bacterium]|nr:hypothetical protein [Pseudonocardiales bacterium]
MSLDAVLAEQSGVISRTQALGAGLSRDSIDHRVRARRWRPLHPSVYLAAGHRLDDEVRVRAALLWAGDGAILSGRAAAWWCGLATEPPPAVVLTIPRLRRLRRRLDVDVRRRDVPELDRAVHRGLAVTAPALTVLETAVALGGAGPRFLDDALRRGAVSYAAVHAAYCRNLNSAGSATAGHMLAAAAGQSASDARRKLHALLRSSRASGWTDSLRIDGQVIDVAFPAARVAIVVSGWAGPAGPPRTKADAQLWQTLTARGWTLLHCTCQDLNERPRAVLAEIARHVTRGLAPCDR